MLSLKNIYVLKKKLPNTSIFQHFSLKKTCSSEANNFATTMTIFFIFLNLQFTLPFQSYSGEMSLQKKKNNLRSGYMATHYILSF